MKKRILILLGILIIGGGAAAGVCWKMGIIWKPAGDKWRFCICNENKRSDRIRHQEFPTAMQE